jgi:hypothetical protein
MLKKQTFIVVALLLVIILAGCNPGDNSDDDYNPYGDMGNSWPSSSTLSTYGLGGMGQPAGISDITWLEYDHYTAYEYPVIYIGFTGTAATDTAIRNYFSSNGWSGDGGSYQGTSAFTYTKSTAAAYYAFSGGVGYIIAGYPTE